MTYTNPHIELREDGKFYLIEMPVRMTSDPRTAFELWKAQALKDAVEIKERALAISFINLQHKLYQHQIKINRPYKVDLSGYDVNIEGRPKDHGRLNMTSFQNYAIITPKAMKPAREHTSETIKRVLDSITPQEQEATNKAMIEKLKKAAPRLTKTKNFSEENSAHSFTEGSEVYEIGVGDDNEVFANKIEEEPEGESHLIKSLKEIQIGEIFLVRGKKYIIGLPVSSSNINSTDEHGHIVCTLFEL
jgi:hypothetical protein